MHHLLAPGTHNHLADVNPDPTGIQNGLSLAACRDALYLACGLLGRPTSKQYAPSLAWLDRRYAPGCKPFPSTRTFLYCNQCARIVSANCYPIPRRDSLAYIHSDAIAAHVYPGRTSKYPYLDSEAFLYQPGAFFNASGDYSYTYQYADFPHLGDSTCHQDAFAHSLAGDKNTDERTHRKAADSTRCDCAWTHAN